MTDNELTELYFRTTLELADSRGVVWTITPAITDEDDASVILAPYTHALILTAENPESSGEYTSEDNSAATAALAHELAHSDLVYRECPGFGFDSDHVEHGFALLARADDRERITQHALELARSYRQNAVFHLSATGLGIIGALRPRMSATRPVRIARKNEAT